MKKQFKTVIDTVAITSDINNFDDFTKVNNERFDCIDRIRDNFDNSNMTLKLNLHTKYGEMNIDTYKKHKQGIVETMEQIGVISIDQVKLNRIDIALDSSDYDYQEDFKKMLFTYELLTIKHKKSSKWYTTDLNTLKTNTIKLYDSRFELEIYDKKSESNGVHPSNIRIEFRYKRLSKDLSNSIDYINKVSDKIKEMDKHLETLEINMSNRLIMLYESEKDNVKSFSEFVRKYSHYFYTVNILKKVYKSVGLKGNCKGWIDDFRKRNTLEFYTTKDIKKIQKAMLRSIKTYVK